MDNIKAVINATNGRSKKYMIGLCIMMFFALGFVMLDRNFPSFLGAYIMEDLGLTNTQFGFIPSVMSVGWGLSAFIFLTLSDKVGRKKVLVPAMFLMAVLSIGTGMAGSYIVLLLVRVMMGVVEAPAAALIPGITSLESPPKSRGLIIGIVMCSGSIVGTFFAPLVGVGMAEKWGWHSAFYIIGIPGIIIALLMVKFLKEPLASLKTEAEKKAKEKLDIKAVLRNRNVWLAAIASACFTGCNAVAYAFQPLLMLNDSGFTPQQMSQVMSLAGLSGGIWIIITPMISDRIGRRLTLILNGIISCVFPITLIVSDSPTIVTLTALVLGTYVGAASIITTLIPAESAGPKLMGTALGINLFMGDFVGGCSTPIIAGVLADKYGYASTQIFMCGLLLTITVLAIFMYETAPRVLEKKAAKAKQSQG
jgi:MFS family permease